MEYIFEEVNPAMDPSQEATDTTNTRSDF